MTQIDRPAVALVEIEQPPRRRVREDLVLRVPLERHADEFGVVAVLAQLAHELAHVELGAAVNERHLRFADENGAGHSGRSGGNPARIRLSRGVAEIDHVAVGDEVLLAFEPQLAVIAAGRERSAREQRVARHDFGANESALDVGVNRARRFLRRRVSRGIDHARHSSSPTVKNEM